MEESVINFFKNHTNLMQKANASGIFVASCINIAEYISLVSWGWTPGCLLYITISSALFIISKQVKPKKIPHAICPFCEGELEISGYKCVKCGKEMR